MRESECPRDSVGAESTSGGLWHIAGGETVFANICSTVRVLQGGHPCCPSPGYWPKKGEPKHAHKQGVFFHEADGLSCTEQVPLVVDFRAAAEGAVRARRQLCHFSECHFGQSLPDFVQIY